MADGWGGGEEIHTSDVKAPVEEKMGFLEV